METDNICTCIQRESKRGREKDATIERVIKIDRKRYRQSMEK